MPALFSAELYFFCYSLTFVYIFFASFTAAGIIGRAARILKTGAFRNKKISIAYAKVNRNVATVPKTFIGKLPESSLKEMHRRTVNIT